MIIGRKDEPMNYSDAMAAADLAERTADAFESEQIAWGRNNFLDDDGRHCVVGGLMRMELGSSEALVGHMTSQALTPIPKASDEVRRRIRVLVDEDTYDWNDAEIRTKEEVIETLKIVAKDLRNGAHGDGGPTSGS